MARTAPEEEEHLDFEGLGYEIPPATPDAWRHYDPADPQPGYYQFDWLSARYPDMYHRFALSTEGLIAELHRLTDLSGLVVVDVGAGTGRSALGVAKRARCVLAVDRYRSVVDFGRRLTTQSRATNVEYALADQAAIPMNDNEADVVMTAWAGIDLAEAYRVLKPDGWLIQMGAHPQAMAGELSSILGIGDAPPRWFDPNHPPHEETVQQTNWPTLPLSTPLFIHEFTYVTDYGTVPECAAILGRIFGPTASTYIVQRNQSTMSWRLRIYRCRVQKSTESPAESPANVTVELGAAADRASP